MSKIEDLKQELAELEAKEKEDQEIKYLKGKIKAKKFGKTKSGKVLNKIADVGDAGFKMTSNLFSEKPKKKGSPHKKRVKVKTIEQIMKDLPQ